MSEKKEAPAPHIFQAEIEVWQGYGNDRLPIGREPPASNISRWVLYIDASFPEMDRKDNKAPGS